MSGQNDEKKIMKLKLLFILVLYSIVTYSIMNYIILDWGETNDLKHHPDSRFLEQLPYNMASVYQLSDSSFLVAPLNPFGKGIKVKDKKLIEQWEADSFFPAQDSVNFFYYNNKDRIDNLNQYKMELLDNLLKYVYKDKIPTIFTITSEDIDSIYKLLKKRKKFQLYELHFIVLIGEYLIYKNADKNYKWAVLVSKQYLNPYTTMGLVDEFGYHKLEELITGKWGYLGVNYIEKRVNESGYKSPDNLEEIRVVK